ncbi:hypothetical protein F511_05991 [Dorcoceras hygrometricum]|uniref:glycerophosphodiester phosphodiesterase n=1 Tax=Dorcoceras hygrometricum TaxID=472368 RepID=A0A2Z7DD88_9LAMI|nr:hypothetical protein F511_05991 [Dorcoceras hygrometricum]
MARVIYRQLPRRKLFRFMIISLAVIAIVPPLYLHFNLQQIQLRKCSWMKNPPLVCAHGGDSTRAFPNTIDAYRIALSSQVDCVEVDVSRSADGVLFALHDRELQQISGNNTSKVGYLSMQEIRGLVSNHQHSLKFHDVNIPTLEDALKLISRSVRMVILDAKVGPPLHEKELAKDILSVVGYIVMMDLLTGSRTNLLRMRGAEVVGVYHPLIDEKVVRILHRRNKKVYGWTVDDEESMQKMLIEHVDAIVTSNPSLLHRVMHDIRTRCFEQGFSLSS